jgi:acyl-[acyl-carrier-protein]-phospholipid O-acyltransferase/long-chain-fatty-acid--[acyl-carrier-protein] ligase
MPRLAPAAPQLRINRNIAAETWSILRHATGRRDLRWAVLGISWFWLVGAAFLAQFPNYAKDVLRADNQVVTLFLTLFSVGIGIGSVLCARLLRGEISARLVPLGALGMALFAFDLYAASRGAAPGGPALRDAAQFLAAPGSWRIVGDLLAIAASGGLFIVPLYALMQARSEESRRSRVVAANNILNALFIVASGALSALLLKLGRPVSDIFLALAVANLVVAAVGLAWRRAFTPTAAPR